MKFATLAAVLASASATYAHSIARAVFINGVDQGLGVGSYIRGPPSNSPVKDLASSAVACNVNGAAVPKTLEVSAGDQITFEWSHDNRNDDIIDPSHKGPVQVYVAPTSSNGAGAVWVKLFSEGFTNDWATNKLIANKGHVTVTVPNLKAGEYLFRPEIVALHEADTAFNVNSARGVQLYMECVQFKVVSAGSVALPAGIDFAKSYTYSDPGLVFDVYSKSGSSYVAPGGAVSSIAVSGQLGIGPVPAAGSKPVTSAAAPAPVTTTKAAATTKAASTTVKATTPLPTTKMTTVTIRSSSTAAPVTTSTPSTGATVAKYGQCGGAGYTGATKCATGSTCKYSNDWYSQCL
ncbi:hypothetical protein BDV93DRAFT_528876 [Ceratobasidium sp. AG-I]|nr:hypothetical protein BDV93DRAFT_528876 [Ceratobasidium sp. AG-I]